MLESKHKPLASAMFWWENKIFLRDLKLIFSTASVKIILIEEVTDER